MNLNWNSDQILNLKKCGKSLEQQANILKIKFNKKRFSQTYHRLNFLIKAGKIKKYF